MPCVSATGRRTACQEGQATPGFHVMRASDVSHDEMFTLESVARVHFEADGRPLAHHVQAWSERARAGLLEQRHEVSATAVGLGAWHPDAAPAPSGEFDAAVRANSGSKPAPECGQSRPWINVLSNAGFGTQVSEAGAGFTWAVNSRLNQLTAWSNDPVADPASECFLLQDRRTGEVWSVAPSACAAIEASATRFRTDRAIPPSPTAGGIWTS